ncbi:hypothetical protein BGX38DRAFT_1262354 [Terfezia claveryi]|nr:hypothetical protein BGX38DRAFT_1262354 [Terfezia claveryi]
MISPIPVLTAGLLLLSSFSSAVPQPKNMETNPGPIKEAEIGPAGEILVYHAVQKRQTYGKEDKGRKGLLELLKQRHQGAFCKLYINLFPVVTQHATVTSCGNQNRECLPTTITNTIDVTQTVTNTVTANTPTVTDDEISSTTTTVTPTTTITSTVGVPLTGTAAAKRAIHPAPFLDDYKPAQISSACSVLIQSLIHATTITITHTVPGTIKTTTIPFTTTVATNTVTTTATPPAVTITEIVATTTVIITASTVTQTTTICPSATNGISGISADPSGSLTHVNAANEVDCCTACIVNGPGCVGWAFLGSGNCFYGTVSSPQSGTPTPQCPFGKGSFSLFSEGPEDLAGGPGPCFSGYPGGNAG